MKPESLLFPALTGEFFTTESPGKSVVYNFFSLLLLDNFTVYKYNMVCLSTTFVGQLGCFQFGG